MRRLAILALIAGLAGSCNNPPARSNSRPGSTGNGQGDNASAGDDAGLGDAGDVAGDVAGDPQTPADGSGDPRTPSDGMGDSWRPSDGGGDPWSSGDAGGGDPWTRGDSSGGDPWTRGDGSGDSSGGDPWTSGDASSGDPWTRGDGDAGGGDHAVGDIWLEVDYSRRSPGASVYSPDWHYSPTPWFVEADWAPRGDLWPYVHVPDGGSLVSDPIGGTVLELGCGARLRIFFGLPTVTRLTEATVTIEGRSRATSSSVEVTVRNPALGTWESTARLANDWTADVVTVPFDAAAGSDFQAVEVSPSAGSCNLAVRRVRLTITGAE